MGEFNNLLSSQLTATRQHCAESSHQEEMRLVLMLAYSAMPSLFCSVPWICPSSETTSPFDFEAQRQHFDELRTDLVGSGSCSLDL